MDYWCCGVWPSIQISRLWRCGSCSGGMQGLVEGRRLHHQGSREDAQSLKNRLEQTIDNSALRHFPALTLSAAPGQLRSCCDKQGSNNGVAGAQLHSNLPRHHRANLVFLAPLCAQDGTPRLDQVLTRMFRLIKMAGSSFIIFLHAGPLGLHYTIHLYLSSAEQVSEPRIPITILTHILLASTYSFFSRHYFG